MFYINFFIVYHRWVIILSPQPTPKDTVTEQLSIIILWQDLHQSITYLLLNHSSQISTPDSKEGGRCFITQLYFRDDPATKRSPFKGYEGTLVGEFANKQVVKGPDGVSMRLITLDVRLPSINNWKHTCGCQAKNAEYYLPYCDLRPCAKTDSGCP